MVTVSERRSIKHSQVPRPRGGGVEYIHSRRQRGDGGNGSDARALKGRADGPLTSGL